MFSRLFFVGSQLLPLIFAQSGDGVFSLTAVPTATCVGSSGQGTASYSTVHSLPTSAEQLNLYSNSKNGYAGQKGANWKIWTDTPGFTFSSVGVPGAGAGEGGSEDPSTTLKKELNIGDDKKSINFTISSDSSLFDRQILIVVARGTKSTRKIRALRARAATTSSPAAVNKTTSSTYNITMTATWPCSSGAGVAPNRTVIPASADVATACLTNEITNGPNAWSQYGADKYLSSLISSATNSPSQSVLPIGGLPGGPLKSKDLDIGSILTNDAAGPNKCTVSDLCELTQCSDIRGQGAVDESDPARFLAFNAYATLSNVLYEFWRALKFANIEELNNQDEFVNTFYQNTPPAVTFQQMIGEVSPFLSLAATISGLIPGIGKLGSVIWIASSTLSEVTAEKAANSRSATLEESWQKSADLGNAIQSYVQNMTSIVEGMYKTLIGGVYGPDYLNYSSGGQFFEFKNNSDTYASTIITNVADTFYLKAVDWVLKKNDVFIMFVPYGPQFSQGEGGIPPVKIAHVFPSFSQKDCEDNYQKGDNGTLFTICDAGTEHKGMARIFQITKRVKANTYTSAITGWDSGFQFPGGWKFNLPDVMRGSLNSFELGGFNFDLDTFPNSNITALFGSLAGNATQPGSFTIPVCSIANTYDTAPNDGKWHQSNVARSWPDVATGYTSFDPTSLFWDCTQAMNYKNFKTGASPDWNSLFINSGLEDDVKDAMQGSIVNGLGYGIGNNP